MLEYAKDWAETDTPWERWEYRRLGDKEWVTLEGHPIWFAHGEYRRKPRTININGYEVPEPLRAFPDNHDDVYMVGVIHRTAVRVPPHFRGARPHRLALEAGLVHSTRAAAELHAQALRSFTKQDK